MVGSNITDGFEVGRPGQTKYHLIGRLAGPQEEYLFNGTLYLPDGGAAGTVIDNFPKGPVPNGWTRRQRADDKGYELVSDSGVVIFGYRVEGDRCFVTTNLYDEKGNMIAQATEESLIINGPCTFGDPPVIRFGPVRRTTGPPQRQSQNLRLGPRFMPVAIDDVVVPAGPACLIEGILPIRGLAVFVGEPKAGKSNRRHHSAEGEVVDWCRKRGSIPYNEDS
jgi:hypothetical protein